MSIVAREIHLKSRPSGSPSEANFELVERRLDGPAKGQLLVRNLWMSVDPYMRGRMNAGASYIAPFEVGAPLEGSAVGLVEQSAAEGFQAGDLVTHFAGWRDRARIDGAGAAKIDARAVPPQTYLGALGVPGFAAYIGLIPIGRIEPGNTVFVSAGSGAVGSLACQIARLTGCRVVASAGSDAKVAWLRDELRVDAAINYRTAGNFHEALARACPNGIDVYFDNVGGVQLDAALALANDSARFPLCGMIDQYNEASLPAGPRNIFQAVVRRITLQGFIVTDHMDRMPAFTAEMTRWIEAGRITGRETIVSGLENAPRAFLGLFRGENIGKMVVDLRD